MNTNEIDIDIQKDFTPLYLIYGLIALLVFFVLMVFIFCFIMASKLFKKSKHQSRKSLILMNKFSRKSTTKKKDKLADDTKSITLKSKNSLKKAIESKEIKKSPSQKSDNFKMSKEKNIKLVKDKNSKLSKDKKSKLSKEKSSKLSKEKSSKLSKEKSSKLSKEKNCKKVKKLNSNNKSLKIISSKDTNLKIESKVKDLSFISSKSYKPSLTSQKNLSSSILFFNTTPISLDHSKLNHSRTSFAISSTISKLPKQSAISLNGSISQALTKSSSNIESFTSVNNFSKCNHKTK